MTDEIELDYAWLTQNAMRGVVREVLTLTEEMGDLPGEHHFYIEFETGHHGVELADRLRGQYPERMTIVLQKQFEELTVTDEDFSVTLQFKGVPERLVIPFAAVTQFADPAANFALQFQVIEELEADNQSEDEASEEDDPTPPEDPEPTGGADVVSLDRFRKK